MRDIIRRNGELNLLDALIAWELEHTPWVHTRKEAEQRALESFTSRSFDNPNWSDYEAFNQKYRPEIIKTNLLKKGKSQHERCYHHVLQAYEQAVSEVKPNAG